MAIEAVQIGLNRYAPEGSDAVNLYDVTFDGNDPQRLTFGQTLLAINIQAAAIAEQRSVLYMNRISANNLRLDLMSQAGKLINNNDNVVWSDTLTNIPENYTYLSDSFRTSPTLWNFFVGELQIDSSILPKDLSIHNSQTDDPGFNRRLQAFTALKDKMDGASRTNQRLQIALRSQVSRRDVAFTTSSNLLKNLIASMQTEAGTLRLR